MSRRARADRRANHEAALHLCGAAAIRFDLAEAGVIGMEVCDIVGRLVPSLPDRTLAVDEHDTLEDLSSLPAGSYVLGLRGAASGSHRLLVVR